MRRLLAMALCAVLALGLWAAAWADEPDRERDALSVRSQNLYDPDACGPVDGYAYHSNGALVETSNFATTGKIPVAAGTRYTFSAGGVGLHSVRYFSGDNGAVYAGTEIFNGQTTGAFTTPTDCTYAAFNLFGRAHTAEQYEAAIASSRLVQGEAPADDAPDTAQAQRLSDTEGSRAGANTGEAAPEAGGRPLSFPGVMAAAPVNLYDKSLAVDGSYIMRGSVLSDAGWAYTGMIPVRPNTQYNLSIDPALPMRMSTAFYEYRADGSYIGATTGGYGYLIPIITGAETAFIAVNMSLDGHTAQDFQDTVDSMMLCCGTTRPGGYSAFDQQLAAAHVGDFGAFAGKRWLAAGTSLTWYDGKTYQAGLHAGEICQGYVGVVSRQLPLLVTNEGINGATLGNVSGDSLINRYAALDWAGVDIATIEYGINDFGNDVPVGTAGDAAGTDTFAACLKTVIEYALGQNPTLLLILCTEPDVRGANLNGNGDTLQDYADVTKEIAAQYRLPVCDWYYRSGINAINRGGQTDDWMTADGTHPNDTGNARMGAMLIRVMEEMVSN